MGSKNKDRGKRSKITSKKVSEESEKSQLLNNNVIKKGKIIEDPRFTSAHSDPRFRKVPKHKSKVVIDSRFSRILTDKNFASSSAPLDKRGRPRKQNAEASLRHYYRIEEEEEEEKMKVKEEKDRVTQGDESEEKESESEQLEKSASEGSGSESSDEVESEDEPEGAEVESSTDTDDEEVVYEDEEEEDMPDAEVENIPVIEQETRRLAVVNLDWRHVRAVDLYVVLRSFLPKGGQILSVSVYPSEFGLQRMKEEEIHGPVGLFDDENEEDDDGDEIDPKKLREYEKTRLRYYYAVVECDNVATADYLYKACDGVEFERSSNVLDLRFIPDSMEFKHPPRDVATEAPSSYEGLDFHTKALQHSNISITWDDDEPQRAKTLIRKFNADQLAEQELKDYLASDDSETEDDDDDIDGEDQSDKKRKGRDKYIALIQSGDVSDEDGEEKGQDMEVTFNTGLEDLSQRILEKKKDKKSESVWDATLRKQREKKMARKNKSKYSSEEDSSDTDGDAMEQQEDDFFVDELPTEKGNKKDRRFKSDGESKKIEDAENGGEASMAELELLLADDKGADNDLKGYNLKRKKAKGKKGKELPDEDRIPTLASNDPRFSALFRSPLYALDPTDPQYKRSASYARQVIQKQHKVDLEQLVEGNHEKPPAESLLPSDEHRTDNNEDVSSEVPSSKHEKHELSSLVRSVKMKSKQIRLPSTTKVSKKREKSGDAKQMDNPDLSTFVQLAKKKKIHK